MFVELVDWLSKWPPLQVVVGSLGRLTSELPLTALLVVLVAQVPVLGAGAIYNVETGDYVQVGWWRAYSHQVVTYLREILRGNFGTASYGFDQVPITRVLPELFLSTLTILGPALLLGVAAGILLGLLSARSRSKARRLVGRGLNIFALSLPDFFVIFLFMVLAVQLTRMFGTPVFPIVASLSDGPTWVYPLLTLVIFPIAYTARVTLNAATRATAEPFVTVARAKGLPEWRITYGHVLRRILPDILASIPSTVVLTISSLVIVEYLFSFLGLGRYMFTYSGLRTHNLTTVALALLAIVLVVRLLADVGRRLADPRPAHEAQRDDAPLW